jgi:hypothetical protein
MYNHVVIILTIIIKTVKTKDHILLHDYVWTLVAGCLVIKTMFWCCVMHIYIDVYQSEEYKCSIQLFTYVGGEWRQKILFTKLERK